MTKWTLGNLATLALLIGFAPACADDEEGNEKSTADAGDDEDTSDGEDEDTSDGEDEDAEDDKGDDAEDEDSTGDDTNAPEDGETEDGEDTGPDVECATKQQALDGDAEVVTVDSEITEDTTWTCDKVYLIQDEHSFVKGATLTIEPGTTVLGRGAVALVIEKDAMIDAEGTADAPIVMTSGEESPARGDWGGLVLLGKATINLEGGSGEAEGFPVPPTYGGDDDSHNCGSLKYVRVEWAGNPISEGNELNGITFFACGSETKASYVQSHMGDDDGIEFFGGGFDLHHIVVTGAADDSIDVDQGFQGNIQHVLVHQDPAKGDNGFEISNQDGDFDATPKNTPRIANATVVGSGDANDVKSKGFTLKEGTHAELLCSIFTNAKNEAGLITHQTTQDAAEAGDIVIKNNIFFGNGATEFKGGGDDEEKGTTWSDEDFEMWVMSESNSNSSDDPELMSAAWESPNVAPGDAVKGGCSGLSGGFDDTSYIGAVDPDGEDWTQASWINYSTN